MVFDPIGIAPAVGGEGDGGNAAKLAVDGELHVGVGGLGAVVGKAGEDFNLRGLIIIALGVQCDDGNVGGGVGADFVVGQLALKLQFVGVEHSAVGVEADVGLHVCGGLVGKANRLGIGKLKGHLQA